MSKLIDKLSDTLSNLGKSDKGSSQEDPLKASESGKLSEDPQATQVEDTTKPEESSAPQISSTEAPAQGTDSQIPQTSASDTPAQETDSQAPQASTTELPTRQAESAAQTSSSETPAQQTEAAPQTSSSETPSQQTEAAPQSSSELPSQESDSTLKASSVEPLAPPTEADPQNSSAEPPAQEAESAPQTSSDETPAPQTSSDETPAQQTESAPQSSRELPSQESDSALKTSSVEPLAPSTEAEPQTSSTEGTSEATESQAPEAPTTETPASGTATEAPQTSAAEEPAQASEPQEPSTSSTETPAQSTESQEPQTTSTEDSQPREPAEASNPSESQATPAVATEESTSKSVEPEAAQSEESAKPAESQEAQTSTMAATQNSSESANQSSGSEEVFVGSIDQGTTSSRFLIFNKQGEPVAVHQEEFSQIYPNSGWHEHDPIEIVESVERCIAAAVETFEKDGHSKDSIKTIGITNQRETTVCWDIKTGEPLYNAIVWTDTRTAGIARELKARDNSEKQEICGLPISSYPSVTKLLWMLRNVDKVKQAFEAGTLAFGTIDAWLIYKLNGDLENPVFVSDPTNASRTMFMDIRTLKYSDEMLDFFSYEFDLRKVHMPEIVKSSDKNCFGKMGSGPLKGWSITGCLGDQSSALVGQKGFEPGSAKNTYGTGCFLLYNVGEKPVISTHGLLATVAYHFEGAPVYALEGSIAVAGSGVKFLMENLGFEAKSHRITELAESVDDNGGLVFVTAFSGLFAPYWIDDAQGTIFGITGHTKRGHVCRATLEAVCFQTKAILDAMEKDSGHKLTELKVDGGMSNSALCMQTQADLTQIPIIRPKMRETTALGAAIAAGFASEVWKSWDELKEVNTAGQTTFEAQMTEKDSKKMFKRWERAVGMCRGWLAEEAHEAGDEDKAKDLQSLQERAEKGEEDAAKL